MHPEIDLVEVEGGVIVPVRAQPKARRNGVIGVHAGRLKIAVTEAPEKGKANAAIAGVLAEILGVRTSQIQLVAGATAAQKKFLIGGATLDSVRRALSGEEG